VLKPLLQHCDLADGFYKTCRFAFSFRVVHAP
jgi:hypothetical protein